MIFKCRLCSSQFVRLREIEELLSVNEKAVDFHAFFGNVQFFRHDLITKHTDQMELEVPLFMSLSDHFSSLFFCNLRIFDVNS